MSHHSRRRARRGIQLPVGLAVGLAIALFAPVAGGDTGDEWGKRVLPIQHQLDARTRFSATHLVGTHNSFGNREDDVLTDFNQPMSIKHQLEAGVRQIGLDVHYSSDALRVCHNNLVKGDAIECSDLTGNRKLKYALTDIKQWVNAGNQDQVVFLRMDIAHSARKRLNKVEKAIRGDLGDLVYGSRDQSRPTSAEGAGCFSFSGNTTKADVLTAGRNVVIVTPMDCKNDSGFNELVFYESSLTNATVNDTAKISATRRTATIYRAADGVTKNGIFEKHKEPLMKPSTVRAWMAAGLTIFELYGYGADGEQWMAGKELPVHPRDMVWSWLPGAPTFPAGDNRCAAEQAGTAGTSHAFGFRDHACSESHRVACKAGGTWTISAQAAPFDQADTACAELSGTAAGARFDVPVNYADLADLDAARIRASADVVWVKYHSLSLRDVWQGGTSVKPHRYYAARGHQTNGTAFDDTVEAVRDLHAYKFRRVSTFFLRSGERVDQVGLIYGTYGRGLARMVKHGGNGGSYHRLDLATGEHIDEVKICVDQEKGVSRRVYYVKVSTDKNRSLEGGTCPNGCRALRSGSNPCRTIKLDPGFELIGFTGRAGGAVDALGVIARKFK